MNPCQHEQKPVYIIKRVKDKNNKEVFKISWYIVLQKDIFTKGCNLLENSLEKVKKGRSLHSF